MPRGRRRGRRPRRNAHAGRKNTVSPRQDQNDGDNSTNYLEPKPGTSQNNENHSCENRASGKHRRTLQTHTKGKEREEIDVDDVHVGTSYSTFEKDSKKVSRFQRLMNFASQLCVPTNNTRNSKQKVKKAIPKPIVDKQQETKVKTTKRRKFKTRKDPIPYTIIKDMKTPHGKVKIYANGELDKGEEVRIELEAVDLLKSVKKVNEKKKKEAKVAAKYKTERDTISKRIRRLLKPDPLND